MVTGFHGQMVKWQKKGFPYCCQVVKEWLYECQLWFQLLCWLYFWMPMIAPQLYSTAISICTATGTDKINIPTLLASI